MPLNPEPVFRVIVTDQGVDCERPDGTVEKVAWSDLKSIWIKTTDAGPAATDFFWVLEGGASRCVVPQGTTGEDELIDRLGQLSGFRWEAMSEAAASASDARFECWAR